MTRRDFLVRSVLALGAPTCLAMFPRDPVPAAMLAGAGFLSSVQSADGSWRSTRYGAFGDGAVLTPLVLWGLLNEEGPRTGLQPGLQPGLTWLEDLTDRQTNADQHWDGLVYPLFTAAYAAQVFGATNDTRRMDFWAGIVDQFQIRVALGWPAEHPGCGAWSDSSSPPVLPPGTVQPPDMLAPNLSATVLGLQATGMSKQNCRGSSMAQTLVEQCQNFDFTWSDLYDGGFFFAPGDSIRNKAGVAGKNESGERYRSYGSATCDGVNALHLCGVAQTEPRMRAALDWIKRETKGLSHAGKWPADRTDDRDSLIFYYAQSFASTLHMAAGFPHYAAWASHQSRLLSADIIARQQPDGSWAGSHPNSFEDDPLVATAFAMYALGKSVTKCSI